MQKIEEEFERRRQTKKRNKTVQTSKRKISSGTSKDISYANEEAQDNSSKPINSIQKRRELHEAYQIILNEYNKRVRQRRSEKKMIMEDKINYGSGATEDVVNNSEALLGIVKGSIVVMIEYCVK